VQTKKSYLRLALGLLLSAVFVWLIVQHISWAEVGSTLALARPEWILAALTAFTLGYACRIIRWHCMLRLDQPGLDPLACAGPFLASFAANNVLPFRAGDVLRAFAFNRQLGTTSGTVLATLFVERLLDLLMLIALLAGALVGFNLSASQFAGVGVAVLLGGALAILALLLFPAAFAPLVALGVTLVRRVAPGIGARIESEASRALATLTGLARAGTLLRLIGWSLAAWLAEGLVFYCAALALPALTVPTASWLALPAGTLATLIPSTPGYVGTFDFFTLRAMTLPGNPAVAATVYAFLVHVLLFLPPTVAGGLYLATHQTKSHIGFTKK
jgi:uncharacterized protein (TIRG00374 family)